jgi:OOP family OmpA-OmpF porin
VVKTTKLILAASFAAAACGAAGVANAQSKQGYAVDTSSMVWRNYSNECWRAGYWTPAMAIAECDPGLVPKPAAAPAPAPAPVAPAPAPAPAAKPAAAPKPVVLRTTVNFASNSAVLDAADKAKLDGDIIGKLGTVGAISYVNVNGHTDRMGSAQYNQKLSEKRADAVRAYLVSKGMDASKIEVYGFGKTTPIPTLKCPDQKDRKALIACLEPNRRTEVELQGAPR